MRAQYRSLVTALALRRSSRKRALRACPAVDVLEGRQLLSTTLPPGSLDPTFGDAGFVQMSVAGRSSDAFAVAVQPSDRKIVVAGITEPPSPPSTPSLPEQWTVVRYNPDGSLDSAFGSGGVAITLNLTQYSNSGRGDRASAVIIQPDGKILVGGESGAGTGVGGSGVVVRYNPDGTLDTTFGSGGVQTLSGTLAAVTSLAMDGSEIVVGGTAPSDGVTTGFVVDLLKSDGRYDSAFGTGGMATYNISTNSSDGTNAVAVGNGLIYAAGTTAAAGASTNSFAVVAFDSTGNFVAKATPQFENGSLASVASVLTIQPNTGKLVVGGFDEPPATGSSPKATAVLVGLNADLTTNASFGAGGVAHIGGGNIAALVSQANGKLVVPDGTSPFSVVRYNADGSIDDTFGTAGVSTHPAGLLIASSIYALAVQPDQNIVAAGVTAGTGGNLLGFGLARYDGASTTATPPPNGNPNSPPPNGNPSSPPPNGNPSSPPPNGNPNSPPPVVVDGPHVVSMARFGVHAQPTTLVLAFDAALAPGAAQDASNYTIVDRRGRRVRLSSAVYDPANVTVTLHPTRQLNLHWTYTITVTGTSPTGLTDMSGRLIDGARTGKSGNDYSSAVDASVLVVTRTTPRAAIALKLSSIRTHTRQAAVRHRG
jgi:uncharacterized delta-60 repeat protein